jgi:peptidoglycan/xylan/chitin deacetylase (PgdA/CDA1 family)
MYFVKTPKWLKKFFGNYFWDIPETEKKLYLTFDDGPHPVATPFVLEALKKHDAKATFFCIGKNVMAAPDIYKKILQEGHSVGNHTHNHLNGWKTQDKLYIENILQAAKKIDSKLYRPPYGRIKKSQQRQLKHEGFEIIMWDVLSGDFDRNVSPENCLRNVTKNARSGSIIVFHDSEKAFPRLQFALPRALDFFASQGYQFAAINSADLKQNRKG